MVAYTDCQNLDDASGGSKSCFSDGMVKLLGTGRYGYGETTTCYSLSTILP